MISTISAYGVESGIAYISGYALSVVCVRVTCAQWMQMVGCTQGDVLHQCVCACECVCSMYHYRTACTSGSDVHGAHRYVQVCICTTLYALAMYTLTVAVSWVRCAARGMGSAHVPVGVNA